MSENECVPPTLYGVVIQDHTSMIRTRYKLDRMSVVAQVDGGQVLTHLSVDGTPVGCVAKPELPMVVMTQIMELFERTCQKMNVYIVSFYLTVLLNNG